jgi:hypothetical protein
VESDKFRENDTLLGFKLGVKIMNDGWFYSEIYSILGGLKFF